MCLWQYWIFLDPQLKWFSWNKPHNLTQNGPNSLFGLNYVPMAIAHVYQKSTAWAADSKKLVDFWYMGNSDRHIVEPK